eukprot:NODE_890_length_3281_cov_0.434318.p1 type:complete len:233 gc:universal NODE_890_length_3281_cov_0.434318:635-1333(+)
MIWMVFVYAMSTTAIRPLITSVCNEAWYADEKNNFAHLKLFEGNQIKEDCDAMKKDNLRKFNKLIYVIMYVVMKTMIFEENGRKLDVNIYTTSKCVEVIEIINADQLPVSDEYAQLFAFQKDLDSAFNGLEQNLVTSIYEQFPPKSLKEIAQNGMAFLRSGSDNIVIKYLDKLRKGLNCGLKIESKLQCFIQTIRIAQQFDSNAIAQYDQSETAASKYLIIGAKAGFFIKIN